MKAITVEPKKPETARLEDVPEPDVGNARFCPPPRATAALKEGAAGSAARRLP